MDQFPKSDRVLDQPIRLRIVAHLLRHGGQSSYVETWSTLGIEHAGILSAHARKLESSGYIELRKSFVGRRANTALILTDKGRRAFADHMSALAAISMPSKMQEASA